MRDPSSRPSESRQRIVAAATELFAESGFDGVSLNAVIERSATSKGTLYHHFASKEDLYATVLEDMLDRVWASFDRGAVEASTCDTFWSTIADSWRRSAAHMLAHPADTRLWRDFQEQWRALGDAGPTRRLRQRSLDMGEQLAERGQALGCVRTDLSPQQCAELVEAVDAVLDGWFFVVADELGEAEAFDVLGPRHIDMIRRMLAPSTAAAGSKGGSGHE